MDDIAILIARDPKSVATVDPDFGTAMDQALTHNRADVVQLLLTTGWDPNRELGSPRLKPGNPLGYAISSGEMEIAETLLHHGADPQKAVYNGISGRNLCLKFLKGDKQKLCLRMLEDNAVHAGDGDGPK